jgi:hypothetical protein
VSHFSKVKTKITDKSCLIKALEDMGFAQNQIEVHDKPTNLYGYQGDKREQQAEIVIRRQYVGGAANDMGFFLQDDGTWGAIVSDYDRTSGMARNKSKYAKDSGCVGYDAKWLDKLAQRYTRHKTVASCAENNLFVESETEENGEIILNLSSSYGSY